MRCQTVFPNQIAELIEERIIAFTAERRPRTHYEAWAITELARATVLVEVGDKRLLEDEVRIINRVGSSYLTSWACLFRCARETGAFPRPITVRP